MQEMTPAERKLLQQMKKMVAYIPVGTRDLLHILKHPDMIELTKEYLEEE